MRLLVFGSQIFNRGQFQWSSYLYFIITKPTTTISAYNTLLYLSIIMLFWSIRGKIEIFNKNTLILSTAQQCKSSSIYIARLFGEIFFHRFFWFLTGGNISLFYLSICHYLWHWFWFCQIHIYICTTTYQQQQVLYTTFELLGLVPV